MKIGFIGIRGIPVIYSAFETFVQVLSIALVKKGHQAVVYCRKAHIVKEEKKYYGVELVILPHMKGKNVSTLTHSFLSTVHACLWEKYDVLLYMGVGSTVFSILPRLVGIKTIVHIDGMDWKRKKWGWMGRKYLELSEYLTTILPNEVITDSQYMVQYYQQRYHKKIHYIPYGYFEPSKEIDIKKLLQKYELKKEKYFVWTGRFVPENYIEDFLLAFKMLKTIDIKCIILGDDFYNSPYKRKIYKMIKQDKRIVYNGFIPHEEVLALEQRCLAYIETKRSGGTHMSLVEAMGVGSLIISHNNPANKEVLGNAAIYYDDKEKKTSLSVLLRKVMLDYYFSLALKKAGTARAKKMYRWDIIMGQYERIFLKLIG